MNSGLSTNTDNLRNLGRNMQSNAEDYKAAVTKIYQEVDTLGAGWKGKDNETYIASVNEYRMDLEKLGNIIAEYGEFAINTATYLEQVQQQLINQANNI